MARRPRRLVPGAALEEDEERAVAPVRVGHLAGEDLDPRAVRLAVVERHLERVLGEDEAVGANGERHGPILSGDGGAAVACGRYASRTSRSWARMWDGSSRWNTLRPTHKPPPPDVATAFARLISDSSDASEPPENSTVRSST